MNLERSVETARRVRVGQVGLEVDGQEARRADDDARRGGIGGAAKGAEQLVVDAALPVVPLLHVVGDSVVNVDEGALIALGPNVRDGERYRRVDWLLGETKNLVKRRQTNGRKELN